MASIIKFPRSLDSPVPRAARPRSALKYLEGVRGKGIFSGLVEGVWVAIVLMWPVLKWVLSIDVVFQLFNVKVAHATHEIPFSPCGRRAGGRGGGHDFHHPGYLDCHDR